MGLLILIVAVWLLVRYYNKKQFEKTTYYRVTKKSYRAARHDTGAWGEYQIYKKLRAFEARGARFLFNVYVPKRDGTTSEIDVIMVCQQGLLVFESKNYSGWIFGNEESGTWTQTLPQGRGRSHKERFYNPIKQNRTHIRCLRDVVGSAVPVWSVIAFSERCTLKKIEVTSPDVFVVNRYDIPSVVDGIVGRETARLTESEIEDLYDRLFPMTQASQEVKEAHVNNIKGKYSG